MRYANITIIEGHDASQYGIGIVSARIAEMVLRDERSAIPIGSWRHTLAAKRRRPRWRDRRVAAGPFPEERSQLEKSAESLRKALEVIGQWPR